MPISRRESGIVSGQGARLIRLGGSFADSIPSTDIFEKTFTPPRGKKWTVIGARFFKMPPAGAANGTHRFLIMSVGDCMVYGESVFGSKVKWINNMWDTADSSQQPATEVGAITALHRVYANYDYPLIVRYENATNAASAGAGEIYISVLETPEV